MRKHRVSSKRLTARSSTQRLLQQPVRAMGSGCVWSRDGHDDTPSGGNARIGRGPSLDVVPVTTAAPIIVAWAVRGALDHVEATRLFRCAEPTGPGGTSRVMLAGRFRSESSG